MKAGQKNGQVARGLGLAGQTVGNWVKADDAGRLRAAVGKPVNADSQEISRLKVELARARMERDILIKRRRILRSSRCDPQGRAANYAFARRHKKVWPVSVQCHVLEVSARSHAFGAFMIAYINDLEQMNAVLPVKDRI